MPIYPSSYCYLCAHVPHAYIVTCMPIYPGSHCYLHAHYPMFVLLPVCHLSQLALLPEYCFLFQTKQGSTMTLHMARQTAERGSEEVGVWEWLSHKAVRTELLQGWGW